MGDVVQTTPTLAALKKLVPRARISFLVKAAFAPLLKNHPCVNDLLPLEPGAEGQRPGP